MPGPAERSEKKANEVPLRYQKLAERESFTQLAGTSIAYVFVFGVLTVVRMVDLGVVFDLRAHMPR